MMLSTRRSGHFLGVAALLFFYCSFAHAQGACPAGLPVSGNNCYFIAANGTDSNNGTSEAAPWSHAPGMPNCIGKCAAVTPSAGKGFIFRGGDTWHFGNSGASPYTGGTWAINNFSGSSGNPIYFGVDQSWFAGSSWARPILTWDNPVCNANTVGGNCNSATGQFYVTSCAFPSSNMVQFAAWTDFDNFEETGICEGANGTPTYNRYGWGHNLTFSNLYIHGWTHVQWNCVNDTGTCTNTSVFLGGSGSSTTPGETIVNTVVDGSDSDPAGAELGKSDFTTVTYNVFRYVSQMVAKNVHLFHDNLVEHWYCPGDQQDHPNLFEELSEYTASTTAAVYDNVWRHITSDTNSCPVQSIVGLWPAPQGGNTEYIFNNLTYDEFNAEVLNLGQNSGSMGALAIFNNTWENSSNGLIYTCQTVSATVTVANSHDITNNVGGDFGCSGWQPTKVTNLLQSHSTANKQGYTSSETYAYSPADGSGGTVGAGTNETKNFCAALSAAAGSDSTLNDAASACTNDTRYACTYNTSNNTVDCPARTVVARPGSGAWDIGAYEFDPQDPPPAPPTGLTAVVQ